VHHLNARADQTDRDLSRSEDSYQEIRIGGSNREIRIRRFVSGKVRIRAPLQRCRKRRQENAAALAAGPVLVKEVNRGSRRTRNDEENANHIFVS